MKKLSILIVCLAIATISGMAQKIKITSGDLASLKDAKSYLVTFDYSAMGVGKFEKEEDYVAKKCAEVEEKGDQTCEEWKAKWEGDRTERFQPKFLELFNEYLNRKEVTASQEDEGQAYEVIVHTLFTEPGYNVGVMRQPASLNFEITIFEKANKDNKVVITMTGVPGQGAMGYDFDAGFRIQESYAKCGKELGALMLKKSYK